LIALLTWISLMIVVLATRTVFVWSSFSGAVRAAGETKFPGSGLIRGLFAVGISVFSYGAVTVAFSPSVRSDWWVCVVLGFFAVCALFAWPRTIFVDDLGIRQSGAFGLGLNVIRWDDVDYATDNPEAGGVLVISKTGARIVLSPMHAGRTEMLEILQKRCRMF
jgi:hypothetical protein